MSTSETTVGYVTTKSQAEETASQWHNPSMGYHAQAVKSTGGYICRLVINHTK